MSKKRTATETSNDEQANEEGPASVFQKDNNAKRAKLDSLSDTTLQHLPMEVIECILVKAVAMEVKGMKLAKGVWKEKADLVISRLGTVCSQWSSILTTNFFRNELQRTLDGPAQKPIRLEMLHQFPLQCYYFEEMTTMGDELFVLCNLENKDCVINVYDRTNMAEVKEVIPLPGIFPSHIASCSLSNCLYILIHTSFYGVSILRIAKGDDHQFKISPLISDLLLPGPTLNVTSDGSLILSTYKPGELSVISKYDSNGSLLHQVRLTADISKFLRIIPTSNGNLVLVTFVECGKAKLTKIDMDGTIIRQYVSSLDAFQGLCQVDMYGRIMIAERLNKMELLDSEFNLLDFAGPQPDEGSYTFPSTTYCNSERNEVVAINYRALQGYIITFFQITEE